MIIENFLAEIFKSPVQCPSCLNRINGHLYALEDICMNLLLHYIGSIITSNHCHSKMTSFGSDTNAMYILVFLNDKRIQTYYGIVSS